MGPDVEIHPETRMFFDLAQIRSPASDDTPSAFGSGLLVGCGVVLTALHCVAIKERGWSDRDAITVYLWRDLLGKHVKPYTAQLVWPPTPRNNPADIAVLAIHNPGLSQPQELPRPLEQWTYPELPNGQFDVEVRGFPRISAGDSLLGGRQEQNLAGIAFLADAAGRGGPTLRFKSAVAAEQAGTKVWAGLSGGPVIRRGAVLAVMRDVPDGWDGKNILSAAVLAPLVRSKGGNADLRRLLGVGDKPQKAIARQQNIRMRSIVRGYEQEIWDYQRGMIGRLSKKSKR
jgi:hypothetical protein